MSTVTITHDGRFRTIRGEFLTISQALESTAAVGAHATWDSLMMAIEREPEAFDLIFSALAPKSPPSALLQEYLELKDTSINKFGEINHLLFYYMVEIYTSEGLGGDFSELIEMVTINGIPHDPRIDREYTLSTTSPAALTGIPLKISSTVRINCPWMHDHAPNLQKDLTIRDIFTAVFLELTMWGLGLTRELNRLEQMCSLLEISQQLQLARQIQR